MKWSKDPVSFFWFLRRYSVKDRLMPFQTLSLILQLLSGTLLPPSVRLLRLL